MKPTSLGTSCALRRKWRAGSSLPSLLTSSRTDVTSNAASMPCQPLCELSIYSKPGHQAPVISTHHQSIMPERCMMSESSKPLFGCHPECLIQAVGDPLIDSVVSENIPILTGEEKFNETVTSIVKRVEAVLKGELFLPLSFTARRKLPFSLQYLVPSTFASKIQSMCCLLLCTQLDIDRKKSWMGSSASTFAFACGCK